MFLTIDWFSVSIFRAYQTGNTRLPLTIKKNQTPLAAVIFTERRGGGSGSGAKNIKLEHPTKAETETMDCVSSDLKKNGLYLKQIEFTL